MNDSVSQKIALLEIKLSLLEEEKKDILSKLKISKKECDHKYLVGGIITNYDEVYYCLSCGKQVPKSKSNANIMLDMKDYFTDDEYGSRDFYKWLDDYYDLAKNRLNLMIASGIPEELIKSALTTELVNYLNGIRKDRGR